MTSSSSHKLLGPDDIATLNNQALELHRLNRLEEALAAYDQLLAIKSDAVDALYNRGNVLKDMKRYDDALASYDKVLALKPDYVLALNNRGFVLHVQQRFDEALKSYDQVLAIKPDHASSLANRDLVLQLLKRGPAPAEHGGASELILKKPRGSHRVWHDRDIIAQLPLFAPGSSGSLASLAELTIAAANETIPLLARLLRITGKDVSQTVQAENFPTGVRSRERANELAELFRKYGSDKSTKHDYHHVYGHILQNKSSITAILEIGLGTNNTDVVSHMGAAGKPGASLRAFRDFLPNAKVYGADVDKRILFSEERIQTFFVDQTDIESFGVLGENIEEAFDLIIDDGLHSPNANLASLIFSLDRIKSDGWIVIEDIVHDAVPLWKVVSHLLLPQYRSYLVVGRAGIVFAANRT